MNTKRSWRHGVIPALVALCVLHPLNLTSGQSKEKLKLAEKISFEMRSKTWPAVFEWLSGVSGLPVVVKGPTPTGTFTFVAPVGKQYTRAEVIDIINEGLLSSKRMLLCRERSFVLVRTDEPVPLELIPRVQEADLDKHGKSEVVSVVITLTHLAAKDVGPEIKKLMGPVGEVVVLAVSNQLIVIDTVSNIQTVAQAIQGLPSYSRTVFVHNCRYVRATDAAKLLKTLLVEAKGQPPLAKLWIPIITHSETTNTIFLLSPPEQFDLAKKLMEKIDVPRYYEKRLPHLRTRICRLPLRFRRGSEAVGKAPPGCLRE